jgi:hypothetical protein
MSEESVQTVHNEKLIEAFSSFPPGIPHHHIPAEVKQANYVQEQSGCAHLSQKSFWHRTILLLEYTGTGRSCFKIYAG